MTFPNFSFVQSEFRKRFPEQLKPNILVSVCFKPSKNYILTILYEPGFADLGKLWVMFLKSIIETNGIGFEIRGFE